MGETAVFDPSKVREKYTDSQWKLKEQWYVDKISAVSLPPMPMPSDISKAACAIDAVLTVARLEMAFIEQRYNEYNIKTKIQESVLYTGLSEIQNAPKMTVAEKESRVKNHINTQGFDGSSLTLYQLREKSDMRYVFMKNAIQALVDKKDMLITHSAAVKADSQLNGLTPNVPTQQQASYAQQAVS